MINLYLLGEKGLIALNKLKRHQLDSISNIIVGIDKNVINDFSKEIIEFCKSHGINYHVNNKTFTSNHIKYSIAIGWRWLIKDDSKLIVFHDSLLPRLRGFNPLVTSLINGDPEIGVTVLEGVSEFDRGPIIFQKKVSVTYPKKIKSAIEDISLLCAEALSELITLLMKDHITSISQDESKATYSLWRDEIDYKINWNLTAGKITRFIDAVGFPYKGAFTNYPNQK